MTTCQCRRCLGGDGAFALPPRVLPTLGTRTPDGCTEPDGIMAKSLPWPLRLSLSSPRLEAVQEPSPDS